MDRNEVKEILGKQLELLAEVSQKCCKPENLAELSAAMCKIADRLVEVQGPLCNDRELMSETIRDILVEQSKLGSIRQMIAQETGSQE